MSKTMAAIAELKKELERAVGVVVEESDDEYNLEATDVAINTLSALKELKLKNPDDQEFVEMKKKGSFYDEIDGLPPEFRCPISGFLMKDPVVLASGQTYDKPFIQKWLNDGHRRCPKTDQLLTHTSFTPNHSIKKMILKWCKVHNMQIPSTLLDGDGGFPVNANQEYLSELLEKLSSPSHLSDAKRATKELRMLTNRFPSIRALFGDIPDPFSLLFHPLLLEKADSDKDLREDLVAIVLNISIDDSNKKRLAEETPSGVSFIVESLRDERIETGNHAAAAVSALSDIDSNKSLIGRFGAIKPLVELIEEGNELALKDAILAFKKLCTLVENRERAVSAGAVIVIMSKIIDHIMMDDMLEILAMLSSHQSTIDEMEEHGAIFLLFSILREKSTSEQNKETCVAILYTICFNDRRNVRKMTEVENAQETLSQVARTGTSRAKRKANGILERLNRFAFLSHTA